MAVPDSSPMGTKVAIPGVPIGLATSMVTSLNYMPMTTSPPPRCVAANRLQTAVQHRLARPDIPPRSGRLIPPTSTQPPRMHADLPHVHLRRRGVGYIMATSDSMYTHVLARRLQGGSKM